MIALGFALLLIVVFTALLMPLVFGVEVYRRRRGLRQVTCPENQRRVAVEVDALHSASTALCGTEYVRLSDCTRWPAKKQCGQDCVYELLREEDVEELPRKPQLAHLPVVVGAALAGLLGAIWYSKPLFRSAWMQLQGLNHASAHARSKAIFPYLVVLAGFFVLGYTIEWLVLRGTKGGVLRGAAMGAMFCLAYVAAELALRAIVPGPRLPLTWVEAAYLVCGGALCGGIVAGWRTLRQALALSD